MLFTDSNIVTAADLGRIDSEIGTVADANQMSIDDSIAQAWSEVADDVLDAQQQFSSIYVGIGSSYAHDLAVQNTGFGGSSRARMRLNQVVVTASNTGHSSPLKNYLTYKALTLFFRNAAIRVDEDRYERKSQGYLAEGKRRWGTVFTQGLPVVYSPLEAPGATHGFNAGVWNSLNVQGDGTDNTGGDDTGGNTVTGVDNMAVIFGIATPDPTVGNIHVLAAQAGVTVTGPSSIPTGTLTIEVNQPSAVYLPTFDPIFYESPDGMSIACDSPNSRTTIDMRRLPNGLYSVQRISSVPA